MIDSLLVANRGEIAVRIIRTCRELGIRTVAVYSEADRGALHVQMADRAVCIGPPPPAASYLNREALLTTAVSAHCDAIHPGVGFLSENADFAEMVQKEGICFLGPDPDILRKLGDKVEARKIAEVVKIPLVPGSEGAIKNIADGKAVAKKIGYPVIIKASAGGGGKGMRIIWRPEDFSENFTIASREAEAGFSDGTLYVEKYLERPRHVELQMLSGGKGEKALVLGERDCTVQNHHQKILEESPSFVLSPKLRKQMNSDAIRLFQNLNYTGAGTVEFLVEGGKHYFMEVNARVQVEHPVTEMTTGIDIIRQQILCHATGDMEITQSDIDPRGYALECRINARTPGKVKKFVPPGGLMVRTDTFLYSGCVISPFYDSLLAKVIVHAPSRRGGIKRMERALSELCIDGIETNTLELKKILSSPLFLGDNFGTDIYRRIFGE